MTLTRFVVAICVTASGAVADQPWTRHTIDDSSVGADGVRLADVNGDGLQDIATGWEEGGETRVYLHPGHDDAQNPWPSVTVGRVPSPEDAVFADLDGDGAMDVITSCEGDERTVYIHWAPHNTDAYLDSEAWSTEALPASKGVTQWMFCLPMDVDGDGDIDLVVGSKNEGAGIGWFLCPDNPRDVEAWEWKPVYNGGWIMSIQAHDIDRDGVDDLLVSDRKGENAGVLWLRQDADNGAWQTHRIGAVGGAEVMFLWGGRFGPEGAFHVVAGAHRERSILHFTQQSEDETWNVRTGVVPDNIGQPKGVAVGDLNQDGSVEIVLSCEGAKDKLGLVALDLETFAFAWDIGGIEGVKFDRIELLDMDGDGDLDVLTCEETAGLGVVWYENPLR